MLRFKQIVWIVSIYVVGLNAVFAQALPAGHHCAKPEKPKVFQSLEEVAEFNEAHEKYKTCILDYIERHKAASQQHYQAASSAIGEWNRYVREQTNPSGS